MDEFCGNTFWDSNVTWYTEDPDLTPCFQNTVLVWIPCAFLWIWSVYQIYSSLHSYTRNIPWNALNIMKLAFSGLLIIIQLLELGWLAVHASDDGRIWYPADYATPALKLATFGLALFLDAFNRCHGVRSSGTVFLFWFLLVVCEAVGFRAAIRQSEPDEHPKYKILYFYILEVIYYPLILGQLLLNCWADAPPRDHGPIPAGDKPCPEHGSSFLSRLFFVWFEKLARMGYKTPLEVDHLWNLNPEDTSRYLNPIFYAYWTSALEKVRGKGQSGPATTTEQLPQVTYSKNSIEFKPKPTEKEKPRSQAQASVLPLLAKMFGGAFMFASLLSLLRDLLTFTTPQILNLLIGHVSEGNTEETWKGYVYAVLLFLANTGSTLMGNQYNYMLFLMGMRIRTVAVSAIYRKAVRISNAAREESTVGEIVNLMSVDTQRLTELCGYLNIIWSAPLQISLSLYFLWQILGPSVLAGVGVMILLLPINAVMATKARQYQMKQMKMKDKRIKLMNEILGGIKVLKLYAWEPSFEEQIMGIRGKEIKVLRKGALLTAASIFVWTCAPFFVSAITFATYVLVDERNVLDAQKAFVSLTLFNIMRMPLNLLPMLIVFLVQASVSIKRINKYMNGEEVQDDAVKHDPNEADQVLVKDGNFAWKEDTPVLRDINFSVKEGQLVAVVGSVGVGKSTLLSALLGEVDHQSGHVHTRGRIAYVAQQPWIQNATVRENILFGLPFDGVKYDRVLDGCALRPDLEILQAGDRTEIGEKGINLSGGQKQRVALARATYNHADLYLFDDPLSAVDSHVAKHLFEKVIGPTGILRSKTRVLVTHGVTFLPQMDNIIVIHDGEISEQGTYKELLAKKGAFADFLIQHIATEEGEGAALEGDEAATAIISDLQEALGSKEELVRLKRQFSKQISTVSAVSKTSAFSEVEESFSGSGSGDFVSAPTTPHRRRFSSGKGSRGSQNSLTRTLSESKTVMNGAVGKGDGVKDRLIEAEGAETGTVKLSVFLFYIRAVGIAMASSVLLLQLACQSFAVGSNLWLTAWANDNAKLLVNGTQTQDAGKRDMYLGVYVGLGVGQGLGTLISAVVMAYGSLRASGFLHYQMFHRILRAPMWFFDTTPTGRIVNRFGKDVDVADNAIPMSMSFWLNCLFWVISTLAIICYVTPIFTAVVLPVAVFYFFAQRYYVATLRQLRRLESVTRSPIYSHFGETLQGTSTIRAFGMQDRFIAESEHKVDHNQTTNFPSVVANRFLAVALEMIGNLVILCAALLAVSSRGSLSAGLVGLSVSYSLQITQSLNWLVKMTTDVETNLVSVERLKEYGEVVQEAEYESSNKDTKPPTTWPDAGEVVFDRYRTRYRDGLDLVLRDVTCRIAPGEKVGIVGRTGAGKSSLTLSLFRLIEAVGGSIRIDGVDISKLGLHDVRRRLTIIPQDPIIFSGSLRLNLDPFNEHSDEEIWRSLELSHLKPFVKGLGSGLAYELTEGGENLSVGQRQLVCLARALLRKTRILVLDEATAAIDLETDDLIQQTIRKEFSECTILTIAHRLNTIMDYGRVMVLDRGVISEFDTPEALLKNKNSIFFGMAKDAGLA